MGDPDHESINSAPLGEIDALTPLLYQELCSIARRERRILSGGETLVTSALINEAYLRMTSQPQFASRADFLRVAATTIRRVLIDRVRGQLALKRGAGAAVVELDEAADFEVETPREILHVHEAVETLGRLHPRLASVVECRFFAGYTEAETAEALGISERTVQSDWAMARAWLRREISAG